MARCNNGRLYAILIILQKIKIKKIATEQNKIIATPNDALMLKNIDNIK